MRAELLAGLVRLAFGVMAVILAGGGAMNAATLYALRRAC